MALRELSIDEPLDAIPTATGAQASGKLVEISLDDPLDADAKPVIPKVDLRQQERQKAAERQATLRAQEQAVKAPPPDPNLLKMPGSVLNGTQAPPLDTGAVATQGVPYTREFLMRVQRQMDAATPEKRAELAARTDTLGRAAQEVMRQYDAMDKAAAPIEQNVGVTPTVRTLDTRREARSGRLAKQGIDTGYYDTLGKNLAATGRSDQFGAVSEVPDDPVIDGIRNSELLNQNALASGIAKGASGLGTSLAGFGQFLADNNGDFGMGQSAQAMRRRFGAISDAVGADRKSRISVDVTQAKDSGARWLESGVENAVSSIVRQAPGLATGRSASALTQMFIDTFGQEYGDARAAGKNTNDAFKRASIFGAFEVAGEKLGLDYMMPRLKSMAKGVDTDRLPEFFAGMLKREVPGELFTHAGESITDASSIGLRQDMTFAQYLSEVPQVIRDTILQTGMMAGAGAGIGAATRAARNRYNPIDANPDNLNAYLRSTQPAFHMEQGQPAPAAVPPAAYPQRPDTSEWDTFLAGEQSDQAFRLRDLQQQQQKQRELDAIATQSREDLGLTPAQQVARAAAATDEEPTAMELALRKAGVLPMPGTVGDLRAILDDPRPLEEIQREQAARTQQADHQHAAQAQGTKRAISDTARRLDNIGQEGKKSAENLQEAQINESGLSLLASTPPMDGSPPADGSLPTGDGTREAPVQVQAPAHVEQAEAQVDTQPTEGQKEAGNYRMGHITVQGLPITIENPKGSVRSGTDKTGRPWSNVIHHTYGYIKGVEAKDGDKLDVFVGPNPASGTVFVIDQIDPGTGKYDEAKVMLGFDSADEARRGYLANYDQGWSGLGAMTPMSIDEFKAWIKGGKTHRPVAYAPSEPAARAQTPAPATPRPATAQPEPGAAGRTTNHDAAPGQSARQPTEEPSHGQGQETPEVLNQAVAGEQPATALDGLIKALIQTKGFAHNKDAVERSIERSKLLRERAATPADLSYLKRLQRVLDQARDKKSAAAIGDIIAEVKTVPNPATAGQTRKTRPAETLLQAIKARGGIRMDLAQELTGEPPFRANRRFPGLFTRNGKGLDILAHDLAVEDGFDIHINLQSENDTGGVRQLEELVGRMLAGETIYNERGMERAREAEYRDGILEQARNDGITTRGRPFAQVEAEVIAAQEKAIASREEELEEEALVAYNDVCDRLRAATEDFEFDDLLHDVSVRFEDETQLNYLLKATTELQRILDEKLQRPGEPETLAQQDAGGGAPLGGGQDRPGVDEKAGRPDFALQGQTEADLAEQERQRQAAEARQQEAERKAAEAERKAREDAEIAARQNVGGEFFSLDAQVNDKTVQKKADAKRAEDQLAGQVDIFGQTPAPPAEPKKQEIPNAVRDRVTTALDRLREFAQSIEDAKSLEDRIGQRGRYQADTWANGKAQLDAARKTLDTFRTMAKEKGIDADAYLETLGGVPELTPSKEAQEWLDAPGRGGVEANTPPAERFEAGRALTKEQRKAVLGSLVDVYRKNKAPKEFKGVDQNGNERYGYAYSPEFFVKSDITGAMVRYYVTLPDGRIAHPTELFPDYTQSDIDAEMQRRKTEEQNRKAADEFRLKTLESRKAGSINEANRLFWSQNRGGFDAQNPEYIPALLTNGTEFIRTDPAYVGRDLELLGDGWQEKAVGEAGGGKPKIQEHKIGDALTIMGRSVILAKQKTIDGVRYELFNDAKLKDTGGATRVIDVDSGNVVSLRTYDDYSEAEAAYEEATPRGGKDAVQPAPAWHTTLPVEGLPPFKDQSRNYAAVPLNIAGEAYDAIRRDQLVAGMKMYAYVMPAANGLNGIVRLLPEDQTPPKPWKLLDGEGLRVSGMTRYQVVARIGEWLRREPILADEKAAPKKGAEEQKPATDFSPLAKDVGGRIAWTDGTIALIEGYSVLNGEPVYIGAKGGQRTRVDIQSFTGNTFTAEEKAALLKARAEAVAQAAEELRKNPDGPFSAGPVVISDDIPEKVSGVAREWIRLLGLDDARIVITTPAAGAEMAKGLFGRFRRIGKANLSGQDTNGIMQPLGDNDYHIALRPGLSVLHTLEALAHELGHIVEKRAFAATKQAFRDEIRAEHQKWLKANGGGRAVDLALAMRAYRSGTRMANTEVGADQVSPYWKSFGEWFADQVSRWATTTAKPMTAVERYFKRLADRLATFFRGERAKFLPNAKVAEWLDSLSPQIGGEEDAAPPAASVRQIQDFGEKIGGARKDVWTSFKDQLSDVSDDDIANQPLSKIWPQPDYQALLDSGADPWVVAFSHAARDEIPAKPRSPWKVKNWAGKVTLLRDTTLKLMDGRLSVERAKQAMPNFMTKGMQDLAGRVELYLLVGHSQSLEGVRIRSGEYSVHNGIEYNPPKTIWTVEKDTAATAFSNWPRELAVGATKEEALQAFKEKYGSLDINPPASKETTFEIYSKHGERGYWIGKKIGRNPLLLEGPFDNIKEARKYKADHQAELVAKLEKAKEIPRERRDTNEPRVGVDMRNGQDVTPQMFGEAFGFRGVEFGNWVEQGRRQKDLNDAFDALMDMAAIIGVPPKALSLNGELGLAFGARGTGGVHAASAHYESGKVVINLTKRSGAGSLGHEWWHAVDNYFARMRQSGDGMMTGALDVSLVSRGSPYHHQGAVRKEMIEAFGAVMKAIRETAMKARSNKLDAKRSKDYWTTDPEMSARAFESYLISKLQDQGASNDYLANIVSPETWKAAESMGFELDDSYPYPTAGEIPAIRAGFDHFFRTVQTRETDKGVAMLSRSGLNDYNEANGILEDTAGHRTIDWAELTALRREAAGLERPEAGKFLTVTEDGRAIATGEPRTRIPDSFARFAEKHGLKFEARRRIAGDTRHTYAGYSGRLPIEYRESGAMYFGEMGESFVDRTGKSRFSRSGSAADFALERLGDALINHEAQIVIGDEIPSVSVPNVRAAQLFSASGELEGNAAVVFRDGRIPMLVDIRMVHERAGLGEKYVRAMAASMGESGLMLYDIQKPAEGFWTKMGTTPENLGGELAHGNGFLFWSDYSQARVSQVHAARPAQDSASRSEHAEGGEDFLGRREAPLERGHDGRIHAEDLSAVAAEFRQVFPGMPIQTADSESQLPKQLRQAIKDLGAQGDTAAAFHDGAVWLVRSGIHSLQHARRIVPHEATHAGLDWLLGQAKDRLLLDINRQNAAVAEKAKDIATRYRYSMVRATEEVLADMGPKVKALKGWNKLVAWVRRQFRKLGWVQEWTDRDVEDLVLQALERAKKGPRAPFGVSRMSAFSRADTIEVDGISRARLNSEGRPIALTDEALKNFWRWFGGSKVVDAEGRPLVVYHGTTGDFDSFVPESPTSVYRVDGEEVQQVDSWDMGDDRTQLPEGYHYQAISDATQLGPEEALKMRSRESPGSTHPDTIRLLRDLRRLQGKTVTRSTEMRPNGGGSYFTADTAYSFVRDIGRYSGGNVMPVYLRITNPAMLNASQIEGAGASFNVEKYSTNGYDGAIFADYPEDLTRRGWNGSSQIVAFMAEQIKSAISNTGEFSADDPDIRFSRTSQAIDLAADVLDTITQPSAKSFGMLKGLQTQLHKARTVPAYGRAFRLAMAFRNDLSRAAFRPWESAKDILPAYDDLKGAWQAILHGKKSSADITAAGRFLFDGTMYGGGNPLAGLVYSDAKLKSMGATDEQIQLYRQAREAIDASLDEVTAAVAWKLAKPYLHPAAKYIAINDPAQARDTFLDMLETARQAAEDEVGYPDQKTAQAAERELRKTIEAVTDTFDHAEALKAAGYAPLMRFGRYTLDVVEVDPLTGKKDRLEFRKFETETEAKFAEKEARKTYAGNPNVIVTRGVQSENSLFQGVDPETVALFAKQVAKIPGLDIDKAVLDEYYRSAVSERSALVRTIKRKGIAGYSEDLPRVLASFLTSNARYASSTWHMGDLREAIQDLRDQKVHGDIADEAQALYDYINGTQEPGAWMRGLMFAWYLGGSPAAAAINLTQPVLMTFPYLAQFGPARAAKALADATVPAVRDAAVPAGLRGALRRAQEEGVVEAQEIHHLYQEGMRPILSKLPGGDSLRARAQGAAAIWGALFGMAENFNRRITFIAAYKMASTDPSLRKRFGSAYEFARRAVEETQGIYAKENRPDWARGTGPLGVVGVAAFTFKQYSIQYVELVARMWQSGPDGKMAAGLMLGLLMLASGLKGLPFADDLKDLVDTILQRLGYRGNAEKAIRDELKTLAGERMADLVLYGLSAETPIDVQGRLGLGNMLPATGIFKPSEINKASQVAELFGPPGGMAKQIGDFADAIEAGKDADAFKAFSPKMVQDITKAWQMWETGEYRDSRNRKVAEVSKGDAAIKAVGFQPQAVAEKTRRDRLVQQDVTRVRGVESNIVGLWVEGIIDKDVSKVAKAREMMRDWNQKNPETKIRVTPEQIIQRVKQARMDREQRMLKSAPKEMRGYVAEGTR